MRKLLLTFVCALVALTGAAVPVTFVTDDGYRISYVRVDGMEYSSPYDGSPFQVDVEPGEHELIAYLVQEGDYYSVDLDWGTLQTFTVGNEPLTVTYSVADNYVEVPVSVLDETGAPFSNLSVRFSAEANGVYYNISVLLEDGGTATTFLARGVTYTAEVTPEAHYAPLSATLDTSLPNPAVNFSYAEGFSRIDFPVTGCWLPEGENGPLNGYLSLYVDGRSYVNCAAWDDTTDPYAIVPDGEYYYSVQGYIDENDTQAEGGGWLTVQGADMQVPLDFSAAQPVTYTSADENFYASTVVTFDGGREGDINFFNATYLLPGTYLVKAPVTDENGRDCIARQAFTVADAPVTVNVSNSAADYHDITFTVTGPNGNMDYTAMVDGSYFYCSYYDMGNDALSDGTYAWRLTQVTYPLGIGYASLPFGPTGTFTVAGADVDIPVDLTAMKFFMITLTKDGEKVEYSHVNFRNAAGEVDFASVLSEGPAGLMPGTYVVIFYDDYGNPMSGTLTVTPDTPENVTVELSDGVLGIDNVAAAGDLAVTVTDGGLRVDAAAGTADVAVFDLSGRTVLTATAAAGETVATTALPAGVYVARVQQGTTVKTVKFVNR